VVLHFLKKPICWMASLERCPRQLSLSFCLGVYIAFSPFVGLHTAMVFLFSWLFALNFTVLLTVSCCINNPWTMVPVYGAGHLVGDWLFALFRCDGLQWNPWWVKSLNVSIAPYLGGTHISLWSFLIGGNLLGIVMSIAVYPIIKSILGSRRYA